MRIYAGVMVHRCKWCCLVMCWRTSPRLVSCQHLWAHSPALCRAPLPGVTRPASPECTSPQCWGLVYGGRFCACSWSPCGRGWCRWGWFFACSRVWACLLAEVWVVLLVVVGVDGAGYVRVRGCSRVFEGVGGCAGRRLGRLGRLGWSLVDDFCGAGVGFSSVRGCELKCWPSSRSSSVLVRRALRGVRRGLRGVRLRSRLWVRLWVVDVTRKDV